MKKIALFAVLMLFTASCSKVSEQDILNALEKNPDVIAKAIEQNPEQIINALMNAQAKMQEEQAKKQAEAADKLKEEEYNNPKKPELKETYNYRGAENAPITIIEYSDLQCPFCARGNDTVKAVLDKYPGKVRVTFKHLPLTSIHPEAMLAAQYYEAITIQDKDAAWNFHDTVLQNQSIMNEDYFKKLAKEYKLDMNKLASDVNSEKVKNKISEDMAEAQKFGFSGTPAFLVNGISISGAQPIGEFEKVIERHLNS